MEKFERVALKSGVAAIVIAGSLFVVMYLFPGFKHWLTCWLHSEAAAAWFGAIGSLGAFAGAIWLARQNDVRRTQEPIQTLEAIFKRVKFLCALVPQQMHTEEDFEAAVFTIKGTATPATLDHLSKALDKFPIERLTSMEVISATFEMQEAVEKLKAAFKDMHDAPKGAHAKQLAAMKKIAEQSIPVRFAMDLLTYEKRRVGLK